MDQKNFSLTAWYINPSRIAQLIGAHNLKNAAISLQSVSGPQDPLSEASISRYTLQDALERFIAIERFPSYEELSITGRLTHGSIFQIYQRFYCRGLSKYTKDYPNVPIQAVAEIHTKTESDNNRKLRILYHPNKLTTDSAWGRLSGSSRLYSLASIESVEANEVKARPYIIGDLHVHEGRRSLITPIFDYGQLSIGEIASFSKISEVIENEKVRPDLAQLRSIPENDVKHAFAEIIGEDNVPKDWGGETSDLFTSNVTFNQHKVPAAFLFKGPAVFSPMTLRHLGANADQIQRLYSEPAKIVILQHCHEVTPQVRNMMRAFASQIHNLKYFSIVDGYDTIRLMQAYGKLGF